jgi:hypothetical protein
MRVALCFFGQPRSIKNPYTYLSHKEWIIDRYNADVFAHAWISGGEREMEFSDWVDSKFKIETKESTKAPDIILKNYKPKAYIFEPPKKFSLDEDSRMIIKRKEEEYQKKWEGKFHYSPNNENNIMSQLYSISKVIELLKNENKYDWVILSRYDNYITDFPELYKLAKEYLYLSDKFTSNFSDVIMFGGQNQIETFDCFDKIPELCKKINYFTPEEFKRHAFYMKYKNQEKRIKIGIAIARSNDKDNLQY